MLTAIARFIARSVMALLISALLYSGCDDVKWNVCVANACRDELHIDTLCSFYQICDNFNKMKNKALDGTNPISYRCGDSMVVSWHQPFIQISGFYSVTTGEMEGGLLDMDVLFECEDSEGRKQFKHTMKYGKQPNCCLP